MASDLATERLTTADAVVAASLAALLIAAAALRLVPGVTGVVHDDAVYVATAKSLAEGHGYRLINLPGEPRQTKYPIVYPAILAAIWLPFPRFPANLVVMQWFTAIAAAAAVALSYLFLVRFRYCSRPIAAAGIAAAATAPMLVYLSTLTMSEMPFALVLVAALWRLERTLRGGSASSAAQVVTGLVVSAPFLVRTIGVTLVVVTPFLLVRQRRPLRWTCAAMAAGVCAWGAWSVPALGSGKSTSLSGYYTDYLAGASAVATPAGVRLVAENLLGLVMNSAGMWLEGLRVGPAATGLAFVFLVVGVGAWALIARAARRGRALPVLLIAYAALVAVWPWRPARFLVPVLPLLAPLVVAGGAAVLQRARLTVRASAAATMAICAVAVVGNLSLVHRVSAAAHELAYPVDGVPAAGNEHTPGAWREYQQLFSWIRERTPQDAIVASGLDSMVFLYTDRQAFRPFVYRPEALYVGQHAGLGTVEELAAFLEQGRASYHVLLPGYADWRELARLTGQLAEARRGLLRPVYQGADKRFVIYAVGGAAPLE
jgi:hypothetical protein